MLRFAYLESNWCWISSINILNFLKDVQKMMEHRNSCLAEHMSTRLGTLWLQILPHHMMIPKFRISQALIFSASMLLAATSCCQGSWAWKIGIIIGNFWHIVILVYPQLRSIATFLAPSSWLQTCSNFYPLEPGWGPPAACKRVRNSAYFGRKITPNEGRAQRGVGMNQRCRSRESKEQQSSTKPKT